MSITRWSFDLRHEKSAFRGRGRPHTRRSSTKSHISRWSSLPFGSSLPARKGRWEELLSEDNDEDDDETAAELDKGVPENATGSTFENLQVQEAFQESELDPSIELQVSSECGRVSETPSEISSFEL
jgi:hypothetical protein